MPFKEYLNLISDLQGDLVGYALSLRASKRVTPRHVCSIFAVDS